MVYSDDRETKNIIDLKIMTAFEDGYLVGTKHYVHGKRLAIFDKSFEFEKLWQTGVVNSIKTIILMSK